MAQQIDANTALQIKAIAGMLDAMKPHTKEEFENATHQAQSQITEALKILSGEPAIMCYFGLLELKPIDDPEVQVRLCTRNGSSVAGLDYNPFWINRLDDPSELAMIFYGEALRLALHHPTTRFMQPAGVNLLSSNLICFEDQHVLSKWRDNVKAVVPTIPTYAQVKPILDKTGFKKSEEWTLEKIFAHLLKEWREQQNKMKQSVEQQMQQARQQQSKGQQGQGQGQSQQQNGKGQKQQQQNGQNGQQGQNGQNQNGQQGQSGQQQNGQNGQQGQNQNGQHGDGQGADGQDPDNQNMNGQNQNGQNGQNQGQNGQNGQGQQGQNGEGQGEGQQGQGQGEGQDQGQGEGSDGNGQSQGQQGQGSQGAGNGNGGMGGDGNGKNGTTNKGGQPGDGSQGQGQGQGNGQGGSDMSNAIHDLMQQLDNMQRNAPDLRGAKVKRPSDAGNAMDDYFNTDERHAQKMMEKWGENDLIDEKIQQITNHIASDASRWGNVSGMLKQMILEANAPKFDPTTVVKHFKQEIQSEQMESTRSKTNRRFGYVLPGWRHKMKSSILFAIDCSGSMSDENVALGEAFVNKFIKHAKVSYCFWDGVCGEITDLKRKEKNFELVGRGCTNPDSVLERLEEEHLDFGGLIFFTDNGFNWERPKNKWAHKIFIISTEDACEPPDWVRYHLSMKDIKDYENR